MTPAPSRTADNALAERLRAWGENDADSTFLTDDALTCLLLDCRDAGKALAQLQSDLAAARKERDRLLNAFHDAIRRPLGVTPDSGAEFYDPRMADEAEARRAAKAAPLPETGSDTGGKP